MVMAENETVLNAYVCCMCDFEHCRCFNFASSALCAAAFSGFEGELQVRESSLCIVPKGNLGMTRAPYCPDDVVLLFHRNVEGFAPV